MDKGNGCSRKSKKYFRPQTDQLGFHSSAGFTSSTVELETRGCRSPTEALVAKTYKTTNLFAWTVFRPARIRRR